MAKHFRERWRCLEILELGPTATEDEIKKAYKTMALKYHPDKNKNEGATEHFQEIQYAYKYLQEGPQILDHTSADDDDGIPIIFLMRLFPWLFQSYDGTGTRSFHRPFFAYDASFDSSSDEEYDTPDDDSSFKSTRSGLSADSSTGAKSRKNESKRQKKKRAKQKRREEKSAAKAQKEKSTTRPAADCTDNLTTPMTQRGKSKDEDSEKPDSGVGSRLSSNNISPTTSDSASGQVPQVEQNQDGHSGSVSEDSSQASSNAEAPNPDSKKSGSFPSQPLQLPRQPPPQPPTKSKQQIKEEERRRAEEAIKIRKELEEKLRLEQERKARKQAAKEEKERQEAERRKREEEEEIAAEAQRMMLEQQRLAEEKERKQKEEEEEKERQRLLAELDSDLYMDASGDFLTRDSEGVGNIKKRTLVYPHYESLWEQRNDRPAFGAQSSYNQPYGSYRGRGGYASTRGRGYPQGGPGRGGSPLKPNFHPERFPEMTEPSSSSWEEQVKMHERLEEQRQTNKSSFPGDDRRAQDDAQFASATTWGVPEGLRQTFPQRSEFNQHSQWRENQPRWRGPFRPHNPTAPNFRGGLAGPQGNSSSSASFVQQSPYTHATPQAGAANHSSAARSADKVLQNGFGSDSHREGDSEHVGFPGSHEGSFIRGGITRVEGKPYNLNRPTAGEVKSPSPEKRDHSEFANISNGRRHEGAGGRCSSVSSDGSDLHTSPPQPHFLPRMHHPFNPSNMHPTGAGPQPLLQFPSPRLPPGFNMAGFVGVPSFAHQPLFTARPATPQPFTSQPAVVQHAHTPSQMKPSAPAFRPQLGVSSQLASHGPQFVSSQQTAAPWGINQPSQGQRPPPRGTVPPFDSKPHSGVTFQQGSKAGGGAGSDIHGNVHGLDDIDD